MAVLVDINEKHESQHNATKKSKIDIRNRENSKIAMHFEHTSYIPTDWF